MKFLVNYLNERKQAKQQKENLRVNKEILDAFTNIKGLRQIIEKTVIKGELEVLNKQKPQAEKLNQIRLLNDIEKLKIIKEKELTIIDKGVNEVISFEMVKGLNKVGNRVLALSDLEEYPRNIPTKNADSIEKVREDFDKIVILYTDYTEETKKIEKEKDPVALGLFFKEESGFKREAFDRAYFITDWEDEHCDLTFEKVVNALNLEESRVVYD